MPPIIRVCRSFYSSFYPSSLPFIEHFQVYENHALGYISSQAEQLFV